MKVIFGVLAVKVLLIGALSVFARLRAPDLNPQVMPVVVYGRPTPDDSIVTLNTS